MGRIGLPPRQYIWPETAVHDGRDEKIPKGAHVRTGMVSIPLDCPRVGQLAYLEEANRSTLWPRVNPGFKRWSRKFVWSIDGRWLFYRIIDVPVSARAARSLMPSLN